MALSYLILSNIQTKLQSTFQALLCWDIPLRIQTIEKNVKKCEKSIQFWSFFFSSSNKCKRKTFYALWVSVCWTFYHFDKKKCFKMRFFLFMMLRKIHKTYQRSHLSQQFFPILTKFNKTWVKYKKMQKPPTQSVHKTDLQNLKQV